MDGTGYPRKLIGEGMSTQAKVMAIADVFEALTAADRPYKPKNALGERQDHGLYGERSAPGPRLFELFLDSGVYRQYGEDHLLPDQIDDVDLDAIRRCISDERFAEGRGGLIVLVAHSRCLVM